MSKKKVIDPIIFIVDKELTLNFGGQWNEPPTVIPQICLACCYLFCRFATFRNANILCHESQYAHLGSPFANRRQFVMRQQQPQLLSQNYNDTFLRPSPSHAFYGAKSQYAPNLNSFRPSPQLQQHNQQQQRRSWVDSNYNFNSFTEPSSTPPPTRHHATKDAPLPPASSQSSHLGTPARSRRHLPANEQGTDNSGNTFTNWLSSFTPTLRRKRSVEPNAQDAPVAAQGQFLRDQHAQHHQGQRLKWQNPCVQESLPRATHSTHASPVTSRKGHPSVQSQHQIATTQSTERRAGGGAGGAQLMASLDRSINQILEWLSLLEEVQGKERADASSESSIRTLLQRQEVCCMLIQALWWCMLRVLWRTVPGQGEWRLLLPCHFFARGKTLSEESN